MKHATKMVAALMLLGAGAAAQTGTPGASGGVSASPGNDAQNQYQIVRGAPVKGESAYQQEYQAAIAAFKAGRLAQAEQGLVTIEQKAPTDPTVHSLLGYIYLKGNKSAQALSEMQTVVRLVPSDPAGRKNLGRAYLQVGQNDKAITQFQAVLTANPADAEAQEGLALGLGQAGRNEEAATAFRKVVAVKPTSGSYQNLGVVLQRAGHNAEAADAFAHAASLDPRNSTAFLNAGQLYAQAGDNDKAIPALQQAISLDTDDKYSAHMTLGQAYAKTDPAKAIAEFAAASSARPTEAAPVYNQAVLQAQAGNRSEAETAYRKVIDLAPSDPKMLADAQTSLGLLLAQDGSADGIPLLTQAAAADPKNPTPHVALANLYTRTHSTQNAINEGTTALSLNPDDVPTRLLVAEALLSQKKYSAAAAQYDAAAQRRPNDAPLQNARGVAHEQAKDLAGAQTAFEASLIADANFAPAENNLGIVYEKQGKKAKAITAYKKAVQMDPTLSVARKNLARFRK